MEVVAFILERGVAVGLALDGDRTKRCSHGEMLVARPSSLQGKGV